MFTLTKVTTEGFTGFGEQALFLNALTADSYSRGELIRGVIPGQTYYFAPMIQMDGGSCTFRVWDYDNGAYIQAGDEQAYNGGALAMVERRITIPTGCYRIQPHFQLLTASTDAYVSTLIGPYDQNTRRIELPAWMSNGFQVLRVRGSDWLSQIAGYNRIYDGNSRKWAGDLAPNVDFSADIQDQGANPNNLDFGETQNVTWAMGDKALWVYAERRRSETEPLTAEDSTTRAPWGEVIAHYKHQLAMVRAGLHPSVPEYAQLVQDTAVTQAVESFVRPPTPPAERRQYMAIRA
jgi:hypothetical protein